MTADVMMIAYYGISGTPAMVVDGEVKSAGKISNKKDVKSWFKNYSYVVITDEGLEKNKNLNLQREDIDRVKAAVKLTVSETRSSGAQTSLSRCDCG